MSFSSQSKKSDGVQEYVEDFSSDTEDQDDPTSTDQGSVEETLASFREKWQEELRISPANPRNPDDRQSYDETDGFESEAKYLFLKGVEMERSGKLYEAIQFYRRAVQLVPDIEFRVDSKKNVIHPRESVDKADSESDVNQSESDSDSDGEVKDGELLQRIQKKIGHLSALCTPKVDQKTTHISTLPMEMVLYILRWVVSADLDLRSLEIFSLVCRGFYLCARDAEIWRLACLKVWGLNCGSSPYNYLSWRHMFIDRTRILFNGCYIGKTTYIRHGESSFQDQFYRPWHLVAYYRYLRFFPEGVALVLTSADEPSQCVGQLKNRNARPPILKGYYKIKDDKVALVFHKKETTKVLGNARRTNRRRADLHEAAEQTFHMELQIKSSKNKRHVQLVWTHYSVFSRTLKGDESTCDFELVANKFPPFYFSRVKSFALESDSPLQ